MTIRYGHRIKNFRARGNMRISFRTSYLSIHSFPDTDLPDFSVITGPNGAGKSHFLQALMHGALLTDAAPSQLHSHSEIRIFDWNSLVPQDTGVFSSESIRNERSEVYNQYESVRHQIMNDLRNSLRAMGLPDQYIANPVGLEKIPISEFETVAPHQNAEHFFAQLRSSFELHRQNLLGRLNDPFRSQVSQTFARSAKSFLDLSRDDFSRAGVPSWGEVGIFQQSFARLFVAYRDALLANQIGQHMASKGQIDEEFLSDEEFVEVNGPPPWDFVNQSLSAAGLDFSINKPRLNEQAPFQPELRKNTSGIVVPFANLSSGEKILMSFAFCVYYANDRRQLALHPKVLLLDEVDAPLHPSMSKNLIQTIAGTLVGAYGIKVIATTHSPSTVAMAPEDGIYVMTPGRQGLRKTSRSEALNILTVGVPTLAISFEGRRQVFVESPSDAKAYDAVYKILKPKLGSERSLEFIATGTRSESGEERNTGCAVVKRLVGELRSAGNSSVFGLIDWDGCNEGNERIAVLSKGSRNGIESVIFDPLLIALFVCREYPQERSKIGILPETSFLSFAGLAADNLQEIICRITSAILGDVGSELVAVEYLGGKRFNVDRRYLEMDDHGLESKLLDAFPFLNSSARGGAGKLMMQIISKVLSDVPDAIPLEFKNVFLDILERPGH